MKTIIVIKANGDNEPFSEEKVLRSMKRAGVPSEVRGKAMSHIKSKLYDEIPTNIIYGHIVEFLDNSAYKTGSRHYRLKRAMMELGPTGHPFEKFIGGLLAEYGYKTEVGVIVQGKCVSHEVDVIAIKDGEHFMVECKYHNRPGVKSDVKVAMYIKSRFEDVSEAWKQKPGHSEMFHQAWLVTNTKLTSDAIAFGECTGMKLLAWGYPKTGSLQDLIRETGLHPLTCLPSLSSAEKQKLMEQDMVMCRDLARAKSEIFRSAGISDEKESIIKKEAVRICNSKQSSKNSTTK